ncbi:uncharacterized protein [Diadema antillarum]|uniref:uncharacterized protein n=1 Tax=Diadema antillarum TaxID=105358 RepID=UPI003A87A204
MTIKGKDFKKAVSFIKEFLLKLPEDPECAELRDSLNLALLHMKKYFKTVWLQEKERSSSQHGAGGGGGGGDKLAQSLPRGCGPSSLYQDDPDRFHWKWVNSDPAKVLRGSLPLDGKELPVMPLILQAIKEGDKELVEQLIEKEASCVHAVDDLGRDPVMYAAQYDRLDCLDLLLESHADPNVRSKDNYTACHVAVHGGNWDALEKLLAHSAETGVQDSVGRAALHWAAILPDVDCLDMLLKYKANRSPRDRDGLTPAMWACHVDNKTHFDMITAQGQHHVEESDGIERDMMGRTWIHWAVKRSESLECLSSLLSPETAAIKDKEGRTVIHLAATLGALDACRLIVSRVGPDCLHETDNHNRTCLHLATMGGHGEVVNFLLDHGADANRIDSAEKTAWDYAEDKDLHYCQMIINSYQPHSERPHSRGRHRHRTKQENNNTIPASGTKATSPQLTEDLSQARLPSPPHPPRLFMQGAPQPKRGHSPRRPSTNKRLSPPAMAVDNTGSHTQPTESSSSGPVYNEQGGVGGTVADDVVICPMSPEDQEAVQYQPSASGEFVQSQEGAIIDSEMQPSSQTVEQVESSPRTPRGRSGSVVSDMSEQSINFGMDVSDIEGEEGSKQEERVNERLTEPVTTMRQMPLPSAPSAANQKLPMPPRPPSPALVPTNHHPPSHHPPSPSAPPISQISPFTKGPIQSPPSQQPQPTPINHPPPPPPTAGAQPATQQSLPAASPRRLMPLGDSPFGGQALPRPLPEGAGLGKGKKKKKRKGSSGSVGSVETSLNAVQPVQPIARSPIGPPEPDFALRPPSPGFLPPSGLHPNHNHLPAPNSAHPTPPTPTPRSLSRSPQPPPLHIHHPQEIAQVAPLHGGGVPGPKAHQHQHQQQQQQQQNRNGAWEVSWEPKRPGMPAPPITPRDGRGGTSPSPSPLLPQANAQGGLLLDRGNTGGGKQLSPRGSSPQPGPSPRGGHSPGPLHSQGGLTDLQRPRTPQMPVTSRFPDTRGRQPGSLPAHPPPGRP